MTLLGCLAAVCAIEAVAGLMAWARVGYAAVGWCAMAAAVRRAQDAGRTWRLPASCAILGIVSMGCLLMAGVKAAFGQDHGAWLAAAAAAAPPCVWLSGVLAFSLPKRNETTPPQPQGPET